MTKSDLKALINEQVKLVVKEAVIDAVKDIAVRKITFALLKEFGLIKSDKSTKQLINTIVMLKEQLAAQHENQAKLERQLTKVIGSIDGSLVGDKRLYEIQQPVRSNGNGQRTVKSVMKEKSRNNIALRTAMNDTPVEYLDLIDGSGLSIDPEIAQRIAMSTGDTESWKYDVTNTATDSYDPTLDLIQSSGIIDQNSSDAAVMAQMQQQVQQMNATSGPGDFVPNDVPTATDLFNDPMYLESHLSMPVATESETIASPHRRGEIIVANDFYQTMKTRSKEATG